MESSASGNPLSPRNIWAVGGHQAVQFTAEKAEGKWGYFKYLRVLRCKGKVGGPCGVEAEELSGGCVGIKSDVFLVMFLEPQVSRGGIRWSWQGT